MIKIVAINTWCPFGYTLGKGDNFDSRCKSLAGFSMIWHNKTTTMHVYASGVLRNQLNKLLFLISLKSQHVPIAKIRDRSTLFFFVNLM